MTKLCYAYIKEYKCLKDVEFCLDARYDIKYDKGNNTLLAKLSEKKLPENFWGDSVSSVTCLIGENGAGKSTIVSFLLNALVDGSTWKSNSDLHGILVYENENNLSAWVSKDFDGFKFPISPMIISPCLKTSIPCFYYSAHFSSYVNSDIRTTAELSGYYNASDLARILLSQEDYCNVSKREMTESLYDALHCYVLQNAHNIMRMIADERISKGVDFFVFPKYVLIQANRSGEYQLKSMHPQRIKEYGLEYKNEDIETVILEKDAIVTTKEQILADIIHHAILNLIVDRHDLGIKIDLLVSWKKYLIENYKSGKKFVLEIYEGFILQNINRKEQLFTYHILETVKKIAEISNFYGEYLSGYLYIETSNKDVFKEKINKIFSNEDFYLVARTFDFSYSQSLNEASLLSSGELEYLNLFSRLYAAFNSKADDLELPQMIFLDEAEIGFHPNWQLKYVSFIIKFLDVLKKSRISNKTNILKNQVQIVIATHSPIMLSDIPKCCTICLTEKHTIIEGQKETFGNNVFELYRYSFLMKNGLVGEFAQEKIQTLNNNIDNELKKKEKTGREYCISEDNLNNIQLQVEMVGDIGLKAYLQDKLLRLKSKDKLIEYYQNKIDELRNTNE